MRRLLVARVALLAVAFGLVATAACSGDGPRAARAQRALRPLSRVHLVAAPRRLREDCAAAADRVGFAVPCPSQVPSVGGHGMGCPTPQGVMPAPCVGFEGSPAYPIFALDLSGFDVPRSYVGVDGAARGHLVVEARPLRDSPPLPCIGGQRIGTVPVGRWTAARYECPVDSAVVQREAMHGEGSHAGHVLLEWHQGSIDYIASAHGHTATNLDFLERLVRSMTLVAPTNR